MSSTSLIKTSVIATAVALAGMSSEPAFSADIGKKMESMFNALSNTTAPGVFETETRGVVTAGGLVIRNQIDSVSLAHVSFPGIDAGCGGIDFFGGSFSFINADQLVEFLKNVASNAIGYAFKMALDKVCPSCLQIVNDMQNLANAMNNLNYNSCQLAQGLLTDTKGTLDAQAKKVTDLWSATTGLASDIAGAFNSTDGESGSTKAKNDETNTVRDLVDINFAFSAAKKAGAQAMFSDGDSDKSTLEFLMSMTGTVVQRLPAKTDSDKAMPTLQTYPSRISFVDFVEGNATKDSEGNYVVTRKVGAYQCDDADKCLNPTKAESGAYKGLKHILIEKLTTPGASTNLAHAFRTQTDVASDAQKNVISFLGGINFYIQNLSKISETTATKFIVDMAPIIAGQVAYENGYRIFQEIQDSFMALPKDVDYTEAQKVLAESSRKFSEGYADYTRMNGGMPQLIDYYKSLMSLAESTPPLETSNTEKKHQ